MSARAKALDTYDRAEAAWAEAIAALNSDSGERTKTAKRRNVVDLVLQGWM